MGVICSCVSSEDIEKDTKKSAEVEELLQPAKLQPLKLQDEKDNKEQVQAEEPSFLSSPEIQSTKSSAALIDQQFPIFEQSARTSRARATRTTRVQPPPNYKAIKGDQVDEAVGKILKKYRFIIPIIRISDGSYLIGTESRVATMKGNSCVVRVGNGYEKLEEYVQKNQEQEQEKLKSIMNDQEKSFKEVIVNLLQKYGAESSVISEVENNFNFKLAEDI